MITIMLVDDHGIVRDGLRWLLDAFDDLSVVACAESGEEAVRTVPALRPDVILMDLGLPGIDGADATREILAGDPAARVIILTSFSDRERIMAALDAGAVGYILKDSPADDLVRAVRAAARGEFPIDPKAASTLLARRGGGGPLEGMSAREVEVLALVGAGLPNKEIARRLAITERTVKGHLTSIFRQIGVNDRTQAALWAERNGVRQRQDVPRALSVR